MVPLSYHSFFSTTAEVAGTLIGLLFVAISLSPEKLKSADVDFEVRAGVAFLALTNALVLSLLALIPGIDLGASGIILSAGGLSSVLGLGVIGFRHRQLGGRLRVLARVVALLALFGVELGYSIALSSRGHDQSAVQALSIVVVAGFIFAIERAWELVGGDGAGVLVRFARLLADRPRPDPEPPTAPKA